MDLLDIIDSKSSEDEEFELDLVSGRIVNKG